MVSILCTYLERVSVEKRSDSTNISNRIGFLLYDFDICICFRFFIIENSVIRFADTMMRIKSRRF